MDKVTVVRYDSAYKFIKLNNRSLQLYHCWCAETGLTRFDNSFAALRTWVGATKDGVAAVYLLPTARDAEVVMSHLECSGELDGSVTGASPEPRRVLVTSCQQWLNDGLVGKSLAMRDLLIVVDLGVGTVSSYVSAMATALFTELQPRDQSPLRTFSILVLQQVPLPGTIGNYLFDDEIVSTAVSRKGWAVVRYNSRTGRNPEVSPRYHPPGLRPEDAGFDGAQLENALAILRDRRKLAGEGEAFKVVVLMNRERFRKLVGAVVPARSLFVHDRTSAKEVQGICKGREPGLTVIGVATTEFCIMPRVPGLQLLIADSTAEVPEFYGSVGHSITREADAAFARGAHVLDIGSAPRDTGLLTCCLWAAQGHLALQPVLFPSHHTGEMYHLIIRLADICPGQKLQEVPCLTLPDKFPELLERVRRLGLWGIVREEGAGVTLTDKKGRLISGLARHEANIHALVLLAGAADPPPGLSAHARHLLVWLAAVVAHGPRCVLDDTKELPSVPGKRGPAGIVAQKGSIWSAVLGVQAFARNSNNAGAETQEPWGLAVEPTEARQVLDSVAFWARKLSLPAISPPVPAVEDLQPHEMGEVEQQLVGAFIYNIASYDMGTSVLADLLSDAELHFDDDQVVELAAAGGRRGSLVFAIYTGLHGSSQGLIPRNLTIVSQKAVFAELVKIAPRPDARPGTSPIDLGVLRFRTITPVALAPAPARPQVDLVQKQSHRPVAD